MCFALYTYHQDEKYRIYYGVNQLFKETHKKVETSKNGGNTSKTVV